MGLEEGVSWAEEQLDLKTLLDYNIEETLELLLPDSKGSVAQSIAGFNGESGITHQNTGEVATLLSPMILEEPVIIYLSTAVLG